MGMCDSVNWGSTSIQFNPKDRFLDCRFHMYSDYRVAISTALDEIQTDFEVRNAESIPNRIKLVLVSK